MPKPRKKEFANCCLPFPSIRVGEISPNLNENYTEKSMNKGDNKYLDKIFRGGPTQMLPFLILMLSQAYKEY